MSATVETARPALPARHRTVLATLLVATFVVILNETVMSVAIPRLMAALAISASTVQWLTTAFMLTMAVVIPTTGFALQRLSTRTVFSLAMSLFCAGTLLAAVAPGFWVLLLARIIQACGTAMMLPLLMTTILTLVPLERRGSVMGNISIAISVAPAIGPTLSGLILQYLPWRYLFVLILPIAIAALAYGAPKLTGVNEPGTQTLDVVSVLLSIPAFGGLVFGLSRFGEGGDGGWGVAVAALVIGVVCLLIFGRRQLALQRRGDPLLDLRAFRYPMYRESVLLLCLAMMALFGVIILLPIYLQTVRGLSSLQTGLIVLPGGLLMGLLAPTVGRLFDRHGPRALTTGGSVAVAAALFGLSAVAMDTPVWLLVGMHLLLSLGLACLFTPTFTTGLNPLPPALYSHGSAILTTLQQVAGAAGVALLVTIMASRSAALSGNGLPPVEALHGGLRLAFLVAAVVSVTAVGFALRLRRSPGGPGVPGAESAESAEPVAERSLG